MTIDEMITVLQAYKDGYMIQAKEKNTRGYFECLKDPSWNFADFDYRVKPKPKEIWVNEFPNRYHLAAFHHEKDAIDSASDKCVRVAVKYREVVDD